MNDLHLCNQEWHEIVRELLTRLGSQKTPIPSEIQKHIMSFMMEDVILYLSGCSEFSVFSRRSVKDVTFNKVNDHVYLGVAYRDRPIVRVIDSISGIPVFQGICESFIEAIIMGENRLVAGDISGNIRDWDFIDGTLKAVFQHDSPVHALIIDPQGWDIISGGTDGILKYWNRLESAPIGTDNIGASVTSLTESEYIGGRIYSGDADGKVKLWDPNGELLHIWDHGAQVNSIKAFSFVENQEYVISAGIDGNIKIFSVASQEGFPKTIPVGFSIQSIEVITDNQENPTHFVVGGMSNTIKAYSISEPMQTYSWSIPGRMVSSISEHPKSRGIIAIGTDVAGFYVNLHTQSHFQNTYQELRRQQAYLTPQQDMLLYVLHEMNKADPDKPVDLLATEKALKAELGGEALGFLDLSKSYLTLSNEWKDRVLRCFNVRVPQISFYSSFVSPYPFCKK